MNCDTILGSHVLQLGDESTVCQVAHLPAPQGCHTGELEVFDEDTIILSTQMVCQLPLELSPLIDYTFKNAVEFLPASLSVVTVRCGL